MPRDGLRAGATPLPGYKYMDGVNSGYLDFDQDTADRTITAALEGAGRR